MTDKITKGDWIVTRKSETDIVILQVDFDGEIDSTYTHHAMAEDFEKYPVTIFAKKTSVHGRISVLIGKDIIDREPFVCKNKHHPIKSTKQATGLIPHPQSTISLNLKSKHSKK